MHLSTLTNIYVSGVVPGVVGALPRAVGLGEVEGAIELLRVGATQRLVRVGAAHEEPTLALLRQHADVVLALALGSPQGSD